MTSKRGYIKNWKPQQKMLKLIEEAHAIFEQNSQYRPLSLRQVFYLGVSQFGWPKTDSFYKNVLSKQLCIARRASKIPFYWFRDDGTTQSRAKVWDSQEQFELTVENEAKSFRLDHMLDQEHDIIVWTEGASIVPVVRQFVDPYAVEVISSGGMDGLHIKKEIADRFRDRSAVILHLGDRDPTGEIMHQALHEDLLAFGAQIKFQRLAVTQEQIIDWQLQSKPVKRQGNTHSNSFDADVTVELEAIPPRKLQKLLVSSIEKHLDMGAFEATKSRSAEVREQLLRSFEREV